MNEVNNIKKC